jgi:hypothetical protein
VTPSVLAKEAAPLTLSVLEALNAPATCKPAETVLEAVEMNPVSVERPVTLIVEAKVAPATVMVEDTERLPDTCNPAETVDEAVEINPVKVERPVTPKVPPTVVFPPIVAVRTAFKD